MNLKSLFFTVSFTAIVIAASAQSPSGNTEIIEQSESADPIEQRESADPLNLPEKKRDFELNESRSRIDQMINSNESYDQLNQRNTLNQFDPNNPAFNQSNSRNPVEQTDNTLPIDSYEPPPASPGGGDDPFGSPGGGVPLDAGLTALLLTGAGYGAKKSYEYRKKKRSQEAQNTVSPKE